MKKLIALALTFAFVLSALGSFSLAVSAQAPYVYHNNITLQQDLQKMADAHPDIAKLFSIGKSVLGQDLWCMEITNFKNNASKPAIYVDGAHHGNEQCGLELCYSIIDFLVNEYATNLTAKQLVDTRRFYIVPLINPDGNTLDTRANAHQVDINRNYPFHWDGSDGTLPITSPASEPEIQANMAAIGKFKPDLYVTFHTGAVVMIYPWGWTSDSPPDEQTYLRLCEEVANRTGIEYGQINGPAMYPAFGTSLDWTYGALGIISYCIEVDGEQWVPLSPQEMRQRLWQSFDGFIYSAQNVELLGAKVEVSGIRIVPKSSNEFEFRLNMTNSGFGNATNLSASVSVPDGTCRMLSSSFPEFLESGKTAQAQVSFAIDGNGVQGVNVAVTYNKTMYLSKVVSDEFEYTISVGDKKIEAAAGNCEKGKETGSAPCGSCGGEKTDKIASVSADRPSSASQLPGFESAILISALVALAAALSLRKRRPL